MEQIKKPRSGRYDKSRKEYCAEKTRAYRARKQRSEAGLRPDSADEPKKRGRPRKSADSGVEAEKIAAGGRAADAERAECAQQFSHLGSRLLSRVVTRYASYANEGHIRLSDLPPPVQRDFMAYIRGMYDCQEALAAEADVSRDEMSEVSGGSSWETCPFRGCPRASASASPMCPPLPPAPQATRVFAEWEPPSVPWQVDTGDVLEKLGQAESPPNAWAPIVNITTRPLCHSPYCYGCAPPPGAFPCVALFLVFLFGSVPFSS